MSPFLFALVEVRWHHWYARLRRNRAHWRHLRPDYRNRIAENKERGFHDDMGRARADIGWWRSLWGML